MTDDINSTRPPPEPAAPTVLIPVHCRACGRDQLAGYPIPVVAVALTRWNNLLLHACCRGESWDATPAELRRIREHLGSAWIQAFATR